MRFQESVVKKRIRLYKLPYHIKKMDKIRSFKREMKSFLLQHVSYSVDGFLSH